GDRRWRDHRPRIPRPLPETEQAGAAIAQASPRIAAARSADPVDPRPHAHLVLVIGDPRRRRPPRRARAARHRREAGRDCLPPRAAETPGDVAPGSGPAPRHDHRPDRDVAASTIAMSCSVVPPLTPTPAITWPSLVTSTPPPIAEYRPPETASGGYRAAPGCTSGTRSAVLMPTSADV